MTVFMPHVAMATAGVEDRCDGRYLNWTGADGLQAVSSYTRNVSGVTVEIENGALHINDTGANAATVQFNLNHGTPNYVIQYDFKYISKLNGSPWFTMINNPAIVVNARLDLWPAYFYYGGAKMPHGRILDAAGLPYSTTGGSDYGQFPRNVWCRVIIERFDARYEITVQNIENEKFIVQRASHAAGPGDMSSLQFTTGSVSLADQSEIYLNNIKVGQAITRNPGIPPDKGLQIQASAYDKIPIYTGVIMPTPRQVEYPDAYISLENIAIITDNNFAANSSPIQYLEQKIKLAGGKVLNTAETRIYIGLGQVKVPNSETIVKAPEKREGYTVKILDKNTIVAAGSDKLGALWAIVSMVQMMTCQDGKPVMKEFNCVDWPQYNYRGMWLCNGNPDQASSFAIAFKLNNILFYYPSMLISEKPAWMSKYYGNYWFDHAPPPEWLAAVKHLGEKLTPLGIKWQVGFRPLYNNPQNNYPEKIDSKSDEQFNALLEYMVPIVNAGGGITIAYDDIRFPLSKADEKNFGSAREADIYFVNKVYNKFKKGNSDFEMNFCPPFYWGPGYEPREYGESRDEYLYAIGKRLPEDIKIYWTGKSVWAGKVEKSHVDWIVERIKRRPLMTMNETGSSHIHTYHYATDPIAVWQQHYKGFYDAVDFCQLTSLPCFASFLITESDYLWNPSKYNPVQAPLEASAKLVGKENVPLLEKLNKALAKLEKYSFKATPGAVKDLPQIQKDLNLLNGLWAEAMQTKNAEMFKAYTGFADWTARANTFEKQVVAAQKTMGREFGEKFQEIVKTAEREVDFNSMQDIIFSPFSFSGGLNPIVYNFKQEENRLCTGIRSKSSPYKEMTASFKLETPPMQAYQMLVCGQDHDAKDPCKIAIEVNGNQIFTGPNPFKAFKWGIHKLDIAAKYLKEGENILIIRSLEDTGSTNGPPFFLLNYIVIKSIKK